MVMVVEMAVVMVVVVMVGIARGFSSWACASCALTEKSQFPSTRGLRRWVKRRVLTTGPNPKLHTPTGVQAAHEREGER